MSAPNLPIPVDPPAPVWTPQDAAEADEAAGPWAAGLDEDDGYHQGVPEPEQREPGG